MEISAIFGAQLVPAPAAVNAADGVFLDFMTEMGAWRPENSAVETIPAPAAWTLLNAEVLEGALSAEDTPQDIPAAENDIGDRTATIAPAVPAEPLPVLPLAFSLALKYDPRIASATAALDEHRSQAASKGQPNINEPGPIASGGGAPEGQLAFAARVSDQDGQLIDALAAPQAQHREGRPQADTQELRLEENIPHGQSDFGEQATVLAEESAVVPAATEANQWHDAIPAAVSTRSEAPPQPANAPSVYTTANVAEVELPSDERLASPVREVNLAIDGEDGRVRLRMETHSGELRAWVTGSSAEAVDRVRAELPELTRSLRESGFKSDVWTPNSIKQVDAAPELHAGSEHGQPNFGADDHRNHDGSRRRRPQPDWFEQTEEG